LILERETAPFTTHPDLIALYEAVERAGKWEELEGYLGKRWAVSDPDQGAAQWLFCLNHPEQIPERMKMVCEWIERS